MAHYMFVCGTYKVRPKIGHEDPEKEYRYTCTLSLTSTLDERVGDLLYAPVALRPGKRPGVHRTEGCVDPRVGLTGCGPSSTRPSGPSYWMYSKVNSTTIAGITILPYIKFV